MQAEIIGSTDAPDEALRQMLRHRMSDYDMNEEGNFLGKSIWRWWGPVEAHTDDLGFDEFVIGYVLEADGHILHHGGQELPLAPGGIYVLDPHVMHWVAQQGPAAALCAYITSMPLTKRQNVDYMAFAKEALDTAWALVRSPPPPNDLV